MEIKKKLLSLKDIAEIYGITSSAMSNLIKRKKNDFPLPFDTVASGPVWLTSDIINFINKENKHMNKLYIRKNKSKKIAIVGRARVGKSFLVSRFVLNKEIFEELFTDNSFDCTPCPIYINIYKDCNNEYFKFHSNFNTINNGDDFKELNEKLTNILNKNLYMKEDMRKIKDIIKEMKCCNRNDYNNYIEVHQKPSMFTEKILNENNLDKLEIIDTPGVSGRIKFTEIEKSDLYLFLLKPENIDEKDTLINIIESIKSEVSTSKVTFLYRVEGICENEDNYKEMEIKANNAMEDYKELFKSLKDNIISTELDLLNPAKNCIPYPTMNIDSITKNEKYFLKKLENKINKSFSNNSEKSIKDLLKDEGTKLNDDVVLNFIKDIMKGIDKHYELDFNGKYTIDEFKSENHNRVKTLDNYRIINALNSAYRKEFNLLYKYFSKFKEEKYTEKWEQICIKYLYHKLSSSIKNDRGLGIGTHPFEEYPARTMLCEESILAKEILEKINNNIDIRNEYIKTLKEYEIKSSTWEYVHCNNINNILETGFKHHPDIIKLDIIKNCLINIKVDSLEEMILYRYIGGLRKYAEYEIIKEFTNNYNESIEILKTFPF